MEAICTARKWGHSIGIVLPRDFVNKEKIKNGEEIIINVRKRKVDLSEFFGALKGAKIDAQKMKDESRKIWDR